MDLVLKVRSPANSTRPETERTFESMDTEFIPVIRSGGWADIGSRRSMEDVIICSDNFMQDFGFESYEEGPSAFYGVCP
jgi:protein phosphatase 2C family protein 2/3